ncbi:hypothetical protein [Eel River basin pequenovirus]|nr:hypothetical protein [Eel River basin pequenovirus]
MPKAKEVFPDPKYVSIVTYNPSDEVRYEKHSDEKLTVAGESYTIPELYARHVNKHNPMLGSEVFYEDTEDFESIDLSKLKNMDLFERQELYSQVTEKAQSALKKIEEYEKEREAKKAKKGDDLGGAEIEPSKASKPSESEKAPESLDNTGAK